MSDDCEGYYDEKCCSTLNYIQSKQNDKQNLPTPPVDREIWWVAITKKANKSVAGHLTNQMIVECGRQRDRKMGMLHGRVEIHWYLSRM